MTSIECLIQKKRSLNSIGRPNFSGNFRSSFAFTIIFIILWVKVECWSVETNNCTKLRPAKPWSQLDPTNKILILTFIKCLLSKNHRVENSKNFFKPSLALFKEMKLQKFSASKAFKCLKLYAYSNFQQKVRKISIFFKRINNSRHLIRVLLFICYLQETETAFTITLITPYTNKTKKIFPFLKKTEVEKHEKPWTNTAIERIEVIPEKKSSWGCNPLHRPVSHIKFRQLQVLWTGMIYQIATRQYWSAFPVLNFLWIQHQALNEY